MNKSNLIIRPVVSKQFCSTSPKVFTVRKRPCAVNGGGFVVIDFEEGSEVFRVEGCGSHVKDHALLKDGEGRGILSIKRKIGVVQVFSLHTQWEGFVRDEIDGHEKPIFKASSSSSLNCSDKNSVKVSLNQSKAKKGWDYEIVGNFSERACAIYDDSRAIVAEVSLSSALKDVMRSKDVYVVTVQAGIDQAFVFGLIAVLTKLSGEDSH